MPTSANMVEWLLLFITLLGTVAVGVALVVTAYIYLRSRQDLAEIKDIKENLRRIQTKTEEAGYISDEIANVLYDLYELAGLLKAYIELRDVGYKVHDGLFEDMNRRVSLTEKHFAELGLFSIDSERRKSVQLALVNSYGDTDTIRIMEKIADGKIGVRDEDIKTSIRLLERRLKKDPMYHASAWTGRPSGGSF